MPTIPFAIPTIPSFPTLPLPSPTPPLVIVGNDHIVVSQRVQVDQDGAYPTAWASRIYTFKSDGTNPIELTHQNGGAYALLPTYSPDGQRIAYLATAKNAPILVNVMDANGSNPRTISNRADDTWNTLLWSNDSQRVAVYLNRRTAYWEIFSLDAQAPITRTTLAASDWRMPNRSPDGKLSAGPCAGTKLAVCFTPVHANDQVDPRIRNYFSWSPDGKRILFPRAGSLYIIDADGKNLKKFADGENGSWQP